MPVGAPRVCDIHEVDIVWGALRGLAGALLGAVCDAGLGGRGRGEGGAGGGGGPGVAGADGGEGGGEDGGGAGAGADLGGRDEVDVAVEAGADGVVEGVEAVVAGEGHGVPDVVGDGHPVGEDGEGRRKAGPVVVLGHGRRGIRLRRAFERVAHEGRRRILDAPKSPGTCPSPPFPPAMSLKILLLGAGGREHALAWRLARSDLVEHIYICPGNGGTVTANKCSNLDVISLTDFPGLVAFALKNEVGSFISPPPFAHRPFPLQVNLVVPGPEQPLVDGIEAHFRNGQSISRRSPAPSQHRSSRHPVLRPQCPRRQNGGLQGLCKGLYDAPRHPHRKIQSLRHQPTRERL